LSEYKPTQRRTSPFFSLKKRKSAGQENFPYWKILCDKNCKAIFACPKRETFDDRKFAEQTLVQKSLCDFSETF